MHKSLKSSARDSNKFYAFFCIELQKSRNRHNGKSEKINNVKIILKSTKSY